MGVHFLRLINKYIVSDKFQVCGLVFGVSCFVFRVSVFWLVAFGCVDVRFRVSGFGFWAPGFGSQGSGFGFRVPGMGSERRARRVWGCGLRVPVSGFRVPSLGFRVPGSVFRMTGSVIRVRGSRFRVLDDEFRISGAGF